MSGTAGKPIKCRAAIAWAPKEPLTIEEIEVAPPRAGQIRIKVAYTSLCHSDTIAWPGKEADGVTIVKYPAILGHEASGYVESVGEGVTNLKAGDKVIPCFMNQCGECKICKSSKSNVCLQLLTTPIGFMHDGISSFTHKGKTVHHFLGISSFSEYTVCLATSCTKVDEKVPLDTICLLSCGVATGYGAAVKTAAVEKGSRCAVWGIGGVGLAVVMGCTIAGAAQIVVIDLCREKFEAAKKLGATDFVNPKDIPEGKSLPEYLVETFDGGFDYTFECIGNIDTTQQALESSHIGWGVTCIVGVAPKDRPLVTSPMLFITGRTLTGCAYGGWRCRDDIPKMIADYLSGKLNLKEFVSHRLELKDINKALELLHSGQSLRTIMKVAGD